VKRGRPRKIEPTVHRYEEYTLPAPPDIRERMLEAQRIVLRWVVRTRESARQKKAA
jgi:hypothetical protein